PTPAPARTPSPSRLPTTQARPRAARAGSEVSQHRSDGDDFSRGGTGLEPVTPRRRTASGKSRPALPSAATAGRTESAPPVAPRGGDVSSRAARAGGPSMAVSQGS